MESAQNDQDEQAKNLVEICGNRLDFAAAITLLESCAGNFKHAIKLAMEMLQESSERDHKHEMDTVMDNSQFEDAPALSDNQDINELMDQLDDSIKQRMAKDLLNIFPEQSKEKIFEAVRRFNDLNEAADHLFMITDVSGDNMDSELDSARFEDAETPPLQSPQIEHDLVRTPLTEPPITPNLECIRHLDGRVQSFSIRPSPSEDHSVAIADRISQNDQATFLISCKKFASIPRSPEPLSDQDADIQPEVSSPDFHNSYDSPGVLEFPENSKPVPEKHINKRADLSKLPRPAFNKSVIGHPVASGPSRDRSGLSVPSIVSTSLVVTPSLTPESDENTREQQHNGPFHNVPQGPTENGGSLCVSASSQGPYWSVFDRLRSNKMPYRQDWEAAMNINGVTPDAFSYRMKLTKDNIRAKAVERGMSPDFTFPEKQANESHDKPRETLRQGNYRALRQSHQGTSQQKEYRSVYNRLWEGKMPYRQDWDAAMQLEGVNPETFSKGMATAEEYIKAEALREGRLPDFTFPEKHHPRRSISNMISDQFPGGRDDEANCETSDDDQFNDTDDNSDDDSDEESDRDSDDVPDEKLNQDENQGERNDDGFGMDQTETSEESIKAKIKHLKALFPDAHINTLRNELQISQGNLAEAVEALEEDFAFRTAKIDKGKGKEREVTEDAQGGSPSLKRTSFEVFYEDSHSLPAQKKPRTSAQETNSSSQQERVPGWARLDNGRGIYALLDSGLYPSKFPKYSLNKLAALRNELRTIDENDPNAHIEILGVDIYVFHAVMSLIETKRLNLHANDYGGKTKGEELLILIKMMVFVQEVRAEIGQAGLQLILAATKKIITTDVTTLNYQYISLAYEKLSVGHSFRELCVHAAFKPWVDFRYNYNDDLNAPDPDPNSEIEYPDAAHKDFLKPNRPPFYNELEGQYAIPEFSREFFLFVAKSLHTRRVPDKPVKSRGILVKLDPKKATSLQDPLTNSSFVI